MLRNSYGSSEKTLGDSGLFKKNEGFKILDIVILNEVLDEFWNSDYLI